MAYASDRLCNVNVTRAICQSPGHKGPRWMLAVFFYRRTKSKSGLQNYCQTCNTRYMRTLKLSDKAKRKRNESSRERKAEIRRERGVPVRVLRNPTPHYGAGRTMVRGTMVGEFTAQQVLDWVSEFMVDTPTKDGQIEQWLNGVQMETVDCDLIRHLRQGVQATVSLRVVDRVANRYDLEIWWMDAVA